MQICRTCNTETDDFYVSNHAECKSCLRARARNYRAANLEKVKAYDRQRGLLPERKEAVKARASRYKGKKYAATFTAHHPLKRAAHNAVNNAIRDGKLVVQPCERCGYGIGIQAHHEDYSKPLEVVWLCPPCHGARHREINDERRRTA